MRVGSLVECTKTFDASHVYAGEQPPAYPTKGELFVVQHIIVAESEYFGKGPATVLIFEEMPGFGFEALSFKEIQPPVNLNICK